MEPQLKPVPTGESQTQWTMPGQVAVPALAPNRVLRNTYWLLALSMLPTVAGAFVGMSLNFAAYFHASPIMAPLAPVKTKLLTMSNVSNTAPFISAKDPDGTHPTGSHGALSASTCASSQTALRMTA